MMLLIAETKNHCQLITGENMILSTQWSSETVAAIISNAKCWAVATAIAEHFCSDVALRQRSPVLHSNAVMSS